MGRVYCVCVYVCVCVCDRGKMYKVEAKTFEEGRVSRRRSRSRKRNLGLRCSTIQLQE